MVNAEAQLREVFLVKDGIVHGYIVPRAIAIELEKYETALRETTAELAALKAELKDHN